MPGGFTFWGLFLALGVILGGYIVWLLAVERRSRAAGDEDPDERNRGGGDGAS